jgi:hypothetical protein
MFRSRSGKLGLNETLILDTLVRQRIWNGEMEKVGSEGW